MGAVAQNHRREAVGPAEQFVGSEEGLGARLAWAREWARMVEARQPQPITFEQQRAADPSKGMRDNLDSHKVQAKAAGGPEAVYQRDSFGRQPTLPPRRHWQAGMGVGEKQSKRRQITTEDKKPAPSGLAFCICFRSCVAPTAAMALLAVPRDCPTVPVATASGSITA